MWHKMLSVDRVKYGFFGAHSLKELKGQFYTSRAVVHKVAMGRVPVGLQDFNLLLDGLSERE